MFKVLLSVAVVLGAAPELNDQTFRKLADSIRPTAEDLRFLEIPWRESFSTAVNEAKQDDRPILLWTMNGHPLGCT